MNTDNLLLILVFVFAQNKQFMENLRPALDFLEEHKGAISVLEQMLVHQTSRENGEKKDFSPNAATPPKKEQEKTQSPLEGIANESILNGIRAYLQNQAR